MKLSFKIFILAFAVFSGCEEYVNPEVENYIDRLKTGTYNEWDLPAFTPSDIPALLKYRNEKRIITDFPHNPISSLWGPECRLGMYVLWTVESIRAVETGSKYLIGRFPSQNPILALKAAPGALVNNEESHLEAARAYNVWWYSIGTTSHKMGIDPLKDTRYRWH